MNLPSFHLRSTLAAAGFSAICALGWADEPVSDPRSSRDRDVTAAPEQKTRPHLGVQLKRPHSDVLKHLGLPDKVGFLVTDIDLGGPAERAGIKKGDLLVKFDDQWLITGYQFAVLLEIREAGNVVNFELWRGGEKLNIDIVIGLTVQTENGQPLLSEIGESELPAALRVIDTSQRLARIADQHGTATLRRNHGVLFLEIIGPRGEVIFSRSIVDDGDRASVPGIWNKRLPLLESALSKSREERRPRVVLPR